MISRRTKQLANLSFTTLLATTAEFDCSADATGCIFIKAGSAVATLTFYGAPLIYANQNVNGANYATTKGYQAMKDILNNAVTMTIAAGNCYPLPGLCFYMGGIKITGDVIFSADISLKG